MAKNNPTRNMNFRETHSERSATASYKNFGKFQKNIGSAVKNMRPRTFGGGK